MMSKDWFCKMLTMTMVMMIAIEMILIYAKKKQVRMTKKELLEE